MRLSSKKSISPGDSKHGFALAIVMVILIALTTSIGTAIYFSNQGTRDDGKRLLLLQATNAARTILAYQAAWIKENGFKKTSPGPIPFETPLINFLNATLPSLKINDCTLYLTKTSTAFKTYIDPSSSANANSPFLGQTVPQCTLSLCTKVIVQAEEEGPSVTLYAALPIIETSFSYFNCAVFFDMDADYYNSNANGFFYINGMSYCNGNLWSTTYTHFQDLIVTTKGFRQTEPALFTSTDEMSEINSSTSWKKFYNSGATGFLGREKNFFYNCIYDVPQYGGAGYYTEDQYYNSLTTNGTRYDPTSPATWDDFVATYNLWYSSGTPAFPINGYRNYRPSNPPAASNSDQRNSYSYAWALLEAPFSEKSYWNKGEGEAYKFSKNACAVIRLNTFPAPTVDASWGLPSMPSPISPLCSASFSGSGSGGASKSNQVHLSPIPTPTSYSVSLLSFEKNNDTLSIDNAGNYILKNFGNHHVFPATNKVIGTNGTLTLQPGTYKNSFATIAPYKLNNNTPFSSFYDPRRKSGIDALIIDVGALYTLLKNGNSDFPDYKPDTDYNGVVYISIPETAFNSMPQGDGGGDGTVTPSIDPYNIRTEGNTSVVWGVVLTNGQNIPDADDPAGGLTIASNAPIYIHGSYGSNHWPCMVAADAVTLLSPDFFIPSSYDSNLLYNTHTTPEANKVSNAVTLNTSILSGITAYWLTGNWSGAGDSVSNIPRTIEDWSNGSLTLRGTVFGLTEPEVSTQPVNTCTNYNPHSNYYPSTINPNHASVIPVPPACSFLQCQQYSLAHFELMSETAYNEITSPQ